VQLCVWVLVQKSQLDESINYIAISNMAA